MKEESIYPEYSIVVPVYNSTGSLSEIVQRVSSVMEGQLDSTYEILFIDDCSPDVKTWATITDLASENPWVKGIKLRKNVGQHQATFCGLSSASGEIIITMDDDLQHDPEDIPRLLEYPEADAVIAVFDHKKQGVFRNLTSRIKDSFDTAVLKKPLELKLTSSFRAIRREVVKEILQVHTSFPLVGSLIWSVTENIVNVKLPHHPRHSGESGYSFWRRLSLFSNLIFNHSALILRFISKLGILSAFGGILFGFFLAGRKIFYGNVAPGWTSIEVTILVIGGLILLSLGVTGEYLYRIITAVEVRPRYVIDSWVNMDYGQDRVDSVREQYIPGKPEGSETFRRFNKDHEYQ